MCECYDPNGLKYCNIHKEMMNVMNKSENNGLENIINKSRSAKFNYTNQERY